MDSPWLRMMMLVRAHDVRFWQLSSTRLWPDASETAPASCARVGILDDNAANMLTMRMSGETGRGSHGNKAGRHIPNQARTGIGVHGRLCAHHREGARRKRL